MKRILSFQKMATVITISLVTVVTSTVVPLIHSGSSLAAAAAAAYATPHWGHGAKSARHDMDEIVDQSSTEMRPLRRALSITASPLQTPLQQSWEAALQTPTLRHASVSAYAYDLTTGQPLASIQGQWQLTPASVMKLFTSAAGLALLGPQFRYHTRVDVAQSPTSGTGAQAIYLVGGGDPWLEADGSLTLEHLARQVAAKIHSASEVIGVSTMFAGSTSGTGWTWDDLPWNYSPDISGLTSERDQLNLSIYGGSPGQHPNITINPYNPSIDPFSPFLQIVNDAVTVSSSAPSTLSTIREPGANIIRITGQVPAGQSANLFFSLHDPALLTATLFERLLQSDGVRISQPASTGSLPRTVTEIADHSSPPLSQYLQTQNTYSINLMAESLFRMLGTPGTGDGSSASALSVIHAWEGAQHLAPAGVQVDGSGLSPLDEVSAVEVVRLLRYAATQPWFTTFEHSLIHIGQTNQCSFMCGLMDQTAADGRVWIKTGNLGNQWNYAGYAHAANGDRIAFAILIDGLSDQFYQQAVGTQDQMTVDVASWPHEPVNIHQAAVPVVVDAPVALRQTLSKISVPTAAGAFLSGALVNTRTGRTLWSQNDNIRMEPALLPRLDLLSASLAAGETQTTQVSISSVGKPQMSDGVLQGPIILSGDGDVNLTQGNLLELARSLYERGIRAIPSGIDYVGRALGSPDNDLPESLPWEDFGAPFAPAVYTMAVQGGTVVLTVRPSGTSGSPNVEVDGSNAGISIIDDAKIGPPGTATSLSSQWERGTNTYIIQGNIASNQRPTTLMIAAPHPAWTAASDLAKALTTLGIKVSGPLTPVTTTPRDAVNLATISGSTALQRIVQTLTDPSDAMPLALAAQLGDRSNALLQAQAGAASELVDPTGLGLENYMTANDMASLLIRDVKTPIERPLVQTLETSGLLVTTAPEQWTLCGYIPQGQSWDALVIIVNGLPWTGSFAPGMYWYPATSTFSVK
ncbi:MAG: D-alanyl-D-alanine carboxypeptidase/D-alanyl-D-alanine-endopeptidase [Firmicutes bacterium]|nr:D-alanyl-D-alanine carboxypeptidase/D-alanyl-D-alanine-endopeptidase [Bacillota bacterium]